MFDSIYASELEISEIERYKCVMFVNAYMQTPEKREKYRRITAGKTRIWLYAEGYCDGKTLSENNLSETVGINLKRSEGSGKLIGCGLLDGVTADLPKDALNPFFTVDDPGAIPLGRLENGEICAAMKCAEDGSTDIWLVTPKLTRELIGPIIKQFGAHIWCGSGDPVLACGGFAAINSPEGGRRVLTLPDGQEIALDLKPYTTEIVEY